MRALICTAGEGKRLRPLTEDKPKSLIKVGKKTILEYMLDNLSEAGIEKVSLITGYKAEKIKRKIGGRYKNCKIRYHINRDYYKTDNMFSLWMARNEIDEGILFFNADIIFNPKILRDFLINSPPNAISVDDQIKLIDDSMKVKIVDGKIKEIGKKIKEGNGWAIGIYKFSPEGAKNYYKEVEKLVKIGASDASFVKPVEIVSQYMDVYAVSTKGLPWAEIDDVRDLENVKKNIEDVLNDDY